MPLDANTTEAESAVFTCISRWLRSEYGRSPADLDAAAPHSEASAVASECFEAFAHEVLKRLADIDGPVRPSAEDAAILDRLYLAGHPQADRAIEALARELHPAVWPICGQLRDEAVPEDFYRECFDQAPPADLAWDSLWRGVLE